MARKHLDAYAAYVHKTLPMPFHRRWLGLIEKLVRGELPKRKLLIIAPPNYAKSTYLSQIFPSWYCGDHPGDNVLFFTSTDTAASQYNGVVRRTMEANPRHTNTFPDEASRPDLVRGWSGDGLCLKGLPDLKKDPTYRAVGWGGSIIGARADGIIIDDPLTQEQAESEVMQADAKSYYQMTVEPRLQPGGWMLGVMTRWHEADLGQYLIDSGDWMVVIDPAYTGEGSQRETLWPERFSLSFLDHIRGLIGAAKFSCLYLGDPTSLGGVVFRSTLWWKDLPSDFRVVSKDDGKTMRTIQYWDLAWSTKASADWTVGTTAGVGDGGETYVLDVWRGREEDDATLESGLVDTIVNQVLIHSPSLVGIEEGAFQVKATRDLIRRVSQKLAGRRSTTFLGVTVDKDKVYRARLHAGRAQAGTVYVDRKAHWFDAWETEHLGFPNAANDDRVDSSSGVMAMVAMLLGYTAVDPDSYTHTDESPTPETWGPDVLEVKDAKVVRFRPRRRVVTPDDGEAEATETGGSLRKLDDDARLFGPR